MSELTTEQLRAAIERLTAEQQRRIAEKVERGDAVLVPLTVVTEQYEPIETTVGRAKERELAALRAAGETREVFFETTAINTGVPRGPGYGKPATSDLPPVLPKEPEPSEPLTKTDRSASSEIVEPQRIWIQTKAASESDPGTIAEGKYTVSGGAVYVTDMQDKPLGSLTLQPDQDAAAAARQLLRAKTAPSFWGPLPARKWWH